MPRRKDLKRLVRTRMQKTGESYTTARAQITNKKRTRIATPPKVSPPVNLAELGGKSDATIKGKTGRDWQSWVRILDAANAVTMKHGDIAALVSGQYGVDGWWAQTVTVGYERIKGLRALRQRLDGTYEAGKSRTFNVPVTELFHAFADARLRSRWLNEPGLKVRTATAPRTMRLGWSDGTIITLGFTAKGESKSSVALTHTKLRDQAAVERMKKYWTDRLTALSKLLA
jgi:hypothetical protein